ncbi:hypothetical protein BK147_08285 [Paenibacillus sp. FSL R7-0337]|uniref:IS3 family transposase n=1 Tax=Paenibacillus sp. FSL R7-0337 TaxID=1926588 RepID=UPI00096E3D4D|nr:hypothetical protein BK147_08285 [Paenibacillus sp. FSL R7-0337]
MHHSTVAQERIQYHFDDHQKRCGSPKITRLLHQEGYTVTERTVSVYMREMKLRSVVSKPCRLQTTDRNQGCLFVNHALGIRASILLQQRSPCHSIIIAMHTTVPKKQENKEAY